MNSTVGPIFNEKVVEKWYLWVTCTIHEKHKTDKSDGKKKKKNTNMRFIAIQTFTILTCWLFKNLKLLEYGKLNRGFLAHLFISHYHMTHWWILIYVLIT